jgi:hemolysin III
MLTSVAASQPDYTVGEEICNFVTHGAALIFAAFKFATSWSESSPLSSDSNAIPLIAKRLMLLAFIILYANSTVYHAVRDVTVKTLFRFLDHMSVVVFMLGTAAPVIFYGMTWNTAMAIVGSLGFVITAFGVWGMCDWDRFVQFELYLYIGFAVVCSACTIPGFRRLARGAGLLFLKGALVYASGVPFFVRNDVRYMHSIFHCFVVAGSLCHYRVVFLEKTALLG